MNKFAVPFTLLMYQVEKFDLMFNKNKTAVKPRKSKPILPLSEFFAALIPYFLLHSFYVKKLQKNIHWK